MVYNGKPYENWMIWGKTHHFKETPTSRSRSPMRGGKCLGERSPGSWIGTDSIEEQGRLAIFENGKIFPPPKKNNQRGCWMFKGKKRLEVKVNLGKSFAEIPNWYIYIYHLLYMGCLFLIPPYVLPIYHLYTGNTNEVKFPDCEILPAPKSLCFFFFGDGWTQNLDDGFWTNRIPARIFESLLRGQVCCTYCWWTKSCTTWDR